MTIPYGSKTQTIVEFPMSMDKGLAAIMAYLSHA